jgi:putative endonuclease
VNEASTPREAAERGALAERIARDFLRLSGFQVLDRNRRAEDGEIDVLARDHDTLVFVEVRLRAAGSWVGPAASIDPRKRRRWRRCAAGLLRRRDDLRWPGRTLRFDAVVMELSASGLHLTHLRGVRV